MSESAQDICKSIVELVGWKATFEIKDVNWDALD